MSSPFINMHGKCGAQAKCLTKELTHLNNGVRQEL